MTREEAIERVQATVIYMESLDADEEELKDLEAYRMAIKALEQEPIVKGKWIKHEWAEECEGGLISNFECDKCQNWVREDFDFCPNCGAKMTESEDKE